jgi:hypothetical protein
MQFVPGISSVQTMPAAPAPTGAGRKPSLWILDRWRDLVLYVCTPLLLVPMFIAAQGFWSAEYIYLFVAAFGAMGHHLPGMIRAYGDRALFQRFRWRFICAPIFLVVVCAAFSVWNLTGIVLVAFIWGVWHGMMPRGGAEPAHCQRDWPSVSLTRIARIATNSVTLKLSLGSIRASS